jgi:hypothetical protein
MKKSFDWRVFLVASITIAAMLLGMIIPGYKLDVEHASGLAAIAVACMVSYAINPSGGLGTLLLSRKFVFSALGFVVLMLDSFHVFPKPLDIWALGTFVILISGYVLMVAKDPGNGWRRLILSRKFAGAVLGVGLVILRAFNVDLPEGVTNESLLGMAGVMAGIIAYAGYQGQRPIPELPDVVVPEEPDPEPETVTLLVKTMKQK